MANIKVSEMTEATSFDNGDYTMIVQANQNKKISKENMIGDIESNISTIEGDISTINTNIGDLSTLNTQNKDNLVKSINSIIYAENYSTYEIKTNKVWIDGKPIYRKVIDLGTLGNKKSINVEGDYDVITDFDGYIYQSSGAKASLVEFASTSLYRAISYSKLSNNNLSIIINRSNTSSWSDWQLKIIIEYTKPTN